MRQCFPFDSVARSWPWAISSNSSIEQFNLNSYATYVKHQEFIEDPHSSHAIESSQTQRQFAMTLTFNGLDFSLGHHIGFLRSNSRLAEISKFLSAQVL